MKFLKSVCQVLLQVADATTGSSAEVTAAFVMAEIAKLPEVLREAITAGNVIAYADEVTLTAKATKLPADVVKPYLRLDATSVIGMAVLSAGKLEPATAKPAGEDTRTEAEKAQGACDYFNYGKDLDVRAKVRSAAMTELEGPEKAIGKAVANLVANAGMGEADARVFVIEQRRKAGLAV